MNTSPTYKNFTLVHDLERRIRIMTPVLKKDHERSRIFEILLQKRSEIKRIRSVIQLGSVVIEFDPHHLPKTNLLILLDAVLGNMGSKMTQPVIQKNPKIKLSGQLRDIDLAIEGMTCASCALLIEMVLKRDNRIKAVSVNFGTETVTVQGQLNKEDVSNSIEKLGYKAYSIDTLSQRKKIIEKEQFRIHSARQRLIWASLLSAPVLLLAMSMTRSRPLQWLQFILTTPVVFWSGKPFFDKAIRLAKHRTANMDSLIALGVGAAYTYSLPAFFMRRGHIYFEAASAIITLVLLGRYLEEKAKGKAGEAIRQLVDLQPLTATLITNGEEFTINADSVQIDDILLIRPGEKIPADGIIIEGLSTVDESMVTGESMPVVKEPDHRVIAGCINGNGMLRIRVTAIGMDTVLAGIVHMIDQAQSAKLPIQKQVDKVSAVFVPAVMVISGLTLLGWLMAGASFSFALGNAITVLLIACPCALGLATPAAIMVGTGQAAKKGIYIRNGESLEIAAKLNVIVFDKTGTITEGKPKVSDFLKWSRLSQNTLTMLAASAEHNSEHFLGKAIVNFAYEQNISLKESTDFYSETGRGIIAKIDDKTILLGNQAWMDENEIQFSEWSESAEQFANQGKTPVFMAINCKASAVFAIADKPKEQAKEAISLLHNLGIETLMATGDNLQTAQTIAALVGIDQVIANAKPEQKLAIIESLKAQGKQVGMIGDGINDAPALTAANVGFAIGNGTDIAIESADLTLVQGDILKVSEAISLSKETIVIIKQNLFWAFAYNTIAIPVAAMGRLNPMLASAAMALSSVSVIFNSLRLNRR